MLEPQNRRLVLETLRPPAGYALDAAIGTTYSLDLMALLTAPLAFALFDSEDENGRPRMDPLTLVEAVRRNADRIAIFCQEGEIKVPTGDPQLLAYLEEAVVGARAKEGFSFHPKLWVLRFVSREPGKPVIYRLICMSRNMTFDRSWDTTVVLEGALLDRQRAVSTANHAVADFVKALPEFAVRRVPERVAAEVERMQRDLRVVRFEIPDPFEDFAFWPLGRTDWKSPFHDYHIDRALVVSPFLSDGFLRTITDTGSKHVLVSRNESIAGLGPKTLELFDEVYSLADGAAAEPEDVEEPAPGREVELAGLHAKLYVAEDGWNASVLTGSANATTAAYGGNVEFLVELRGKRSKCGVDALLATAEGQASLRSLLQKLEPPWGVPVEPATRALEKRITAAKLALVKAEPRLRFADSEAELFDVALLLQGLDLPAGIEARCWPITLRDEAARRLESGVAEVSLGRLSFAGLTAFVAFDFEAHDEQGASMASRFVLSLPVEGMPAGRRERVLKSILRDGGQVLRLLLLLLEDPEEPGFGEILVGPSRVGSAGSGISGWSERQLFESLLKTLSHNPERLDDVAGLVNELKGSPETAGLLPPGFDEIWRPICEARERMKGERQQG